MGDSRVLSDIRDHYQTLIDQSFKDVIGIRDVFPRSVGDVPTIRHDFDSLVPRKPLHPLLVLAIMEIESWFIGEHTHFRKVHSTLTESVVNGALGYDPATCDLEAIPRPVEDLRTLYALAGRGYSKDRRQIQRTVEHLDYARFYNELPTRLSDLANLIAHLNAFLT